MSFATIYIMRGNFNWMEVHLRIPRFNRIFLLYCLPSMNFYWTQVGFETHWFWQAKKNWLAIQPLREFSLADHTCTLGRRWTAPSHHKPIERVWVIWSNTARFWFRYFLASENDGQALQHSYLLRSWHNRIYIHTYINTDLYMSSYHDIEVSLIVFSEGGYETESAE